MPKMKTHRGAAKRFKVTGTGKFIKRKSCKNHMLEKKSANRKRHLGKQEVVSSADEGRVKRMLPYA